MEVLRDLHKFDTANQYIAAGLIWARLCARVRRDLCRGQHTSVASVPGGHVRRRRAEARGAVHSDADGRAHGDQVSSTSQAEHDGTAAWFHSIQMISR